MDQATEVAFKKSADRAVRFYLELVRLLDEFNLVTYQAHAAVAWTELTVNAGNYTTETAVPSGNAAIQLTAHQYKVITTLLSDLLATVQDGDGAGQLVVDGVTYDIAALDALAESIRK